MGTSGEGERKSNDKTSKSRSRNAWRARNIVSCCCSCCFFGSFQSFLASASFASVRKAQINVVSVVLLRHQPENVKGKRKTEQTPVGTFGTAKESFRGPTCYYLKRPSATSALCYADVNVNGGGEGPPVLGKTPELHRISLLFSFQQTPDPAPLRGREGKESQVAGGHPKANLSECIFPVRRPNFCLGHHQRYSVPPIWFP